MRRLLLFVCYRKARGENERGCEIERKCLQACERDFHNLGRGVEGHRSNRWSPASSAAASWFRHLNIPAAYEARREDEETPNGDKQHTPSLLAHVPRVHVPCGLTSLPPNPPTKPLPTPAALSLQLPVTGPGERGGGEKSFPSGTVRSAWSEMGARGVMCPSTSVTRLLCQ